MNDSPHTLDRLPGIVGCIALVSLLTVSLHATQYHVSIIDQMPNIPANLNVRNWSLEASNYDAFMFNAIGTGAYQPTMWWDDSRVNMPTTTFGFPSYIGGNQSGSDHEAITNMSAVVS